MFRPCQENSHVVLRLIRALGRGWGGTRLQGPYISETGTEGFSAHTCLLQRSPATACIGPSLSKWISTLPLHVGRGGVGYPLWSREREAPATYSVPVSWLHVPASGYIRVAPISSVSHPVRSAWEGAHPPHPFPVHSDQPSLPTVAVNLLFFSASNSCLPCSPCTAARPWQEGPSARAQQARGQAGGRRGGCQASAC